MRISDPADFHFPTSVVHLEADEAWSLLNNAELILLDIRTPMEFMAGHLSGAINIDYYDAEFAEQLKKLDREAAYFLYCRSGNRTSHSLSLFQSLGFKKIYHLYGGIIDWVASGYGLIVREE